MEGVKVLEFIGLVNGTPVDVYEHDIHNCVERLIYLLLNVLIHLLVWAGNLVRL